MRAFLGMGTLLGIALAVPVATSAADLRESLRCREIHFSHTAEQRDVDAFKAMMDADVRWLTSGGMLRGPDAVAQAWGAFFSENGPSIAWRPEVTEVLESGDLALSRGPYRLTATDADGNPVERWGLFQSVWRRAADGRWLIVFDAGAEDGMQPSDGQRHLFEMEIGCAPYPGSEAD